MPLWAGNLVVKSCVFNEISHMIILVSSILWHKSQNRRSLPGNCNQNTFLQQWINTTKKNYWKVNMQQYRSCGKLYFLCSPWRIYTARIAGQGSKSWVWWDSEPRINLLARASSSLTVSQWVDSHGLEVYASHHQAWTWVRKQRSCTVRHRYQAIASEDYSRLKRSMCSSDLLSM